MVQRPKITIIGAGNVGASVAQCIAARGLGDVVLLDVVEGLAEGVASDLLQSAPIGGFDLRIVDGTDYGGTADSDIVIIASGAARKPRMSREDLLRANGRIVESVAQEAVRWSPDCVLIVVTDPADAMTYLAWRLTGLARNRVLGQSGVLDSCRFRAFIAEELAVSIEDVQALVLGGHGDEMVPLPRYSTVAGIPISQLLECYRIQKIIERTICASAEIVDPARTGGALMAPAAAVTETAEAILKDKKRIMPCSAYLDGQYDLNDIYFGVPVKLGAGGVEEVVEVELTNAERDLLDRSASRVRESIESLGLKLKGGGSDEKNILGGAGCRSVPYRRHGYSPGDIL